MAATVQNDAIKMIVSVVHALYSIVYWSRGCDHFLLFWFQYFIDWRVVIPISAAFQVLKHVLILLWSSRSPLFLWMCNCHNLCFQDESPVLCGHQDACALSLPFQPAHRFTRLGHFSSQISLSWSEQGIELMSPFILWYSHLTLCLCFFKKEKFRLIHRHKIFDKLAHFYKIQLNQKFDGCSQTILLFSWRSSKGLKRFKF